MTFRPGDDILDDSQRTRPSTYPPVPARPGLVVEDRASGFCGDVVQVSAGAVTLRDRTGNLRQFTLKPGGFLLEGTPVTLVRPAAAPAAPRRTASGSVAAPGAPRAVTAAASRIWVEGIHDAELVEHVWGDDLRELGVVVEPLHGIDGLAEAVAGFAPGSQRRLGILVDHLVPGSKEERLARSVRHPAVLVTGHPFVDVWEGVRPDRVGITAWPVVPMGEPWKQGVCRALGVDPAGFWPSLRNRVRSFADLRPELVGAVEQLIDFVSAG